MEIKRILDLLQKSFDGPAWHGPSVMEVLATVIPPVESIKKIPATHSIIELVLHMATWREFATKRLKGDNEYEVSEEKNFPKDKDWSAAIKTLQRSQVELLAATGEFPEGELKKTVPGRTYDFYTLLHGIIQHDIYHIGQIVLLIKAV